MKIPYRIYFLLILTAALAAVASPQTKRPKKVKATPVTAVQPEPKSLPTPEPKAAVPAKRNERPGGEAAKTDAELNKVNPANPAYFYEFTRPGFSYGRILIEHNDAGEGKISFLKDGFDEMITDPIDLSPVTLAKINVALAELKFLDSTEDYQYARDYSHMGNVTFTVNRDGRSRTAKYNWTENKNAKMLMDEYRRIGNEYTWRFEISVARQNQPLQTPGLMDAIDGYVRRGEISDPEHLLPFLTELSTDERLPLIARNRAAKLVKQIEKQKAK